jgi:hypothetical protein
MAPKKKGEALGAPQAEPEPEDFDVEAWLDNSSRPERSVTVYGDGKGYAELQELQERYEALDDQAEGDESLGAVGAREQFRTEYDTIRQRVEASKRSFRVRAVTEDKMKAIRDRMGEDATEHEVGMAVLAAGCVRPKLTEAQAKRLSDRIGIGQVTLLIMAANEASFASKVEIPTLPAPYRSRDIED